MCVCGRAITIPPGSFAKACPVHLHSPPSLFFFCNRYMFLQLFSASVQTCRKGLWKRQGALEKARGFGKGQQQSHDKEAQRLAARI